MRQTIITVAIGLTGLLVAGALFALALGKPQAPEVAVVPVSEAAPAPVADATQTSPAESTGEVPAPDPPSPLAVEIPGCRCHSDDPELVQEHAGYRMNQCFGCHSGGMPEMGR